MARSQPNLLSLIDGEGEIVDNEKEKDIEILDRLPPMSKLRTALSNPNLLDVDEKVCTPKTLVFLIEEYPPTISFLII